MADVGIIMGSDSDFRVMRDTVDILTELKVCYTVNVVSAHRTPSRLYEYARGAKSEGYKVIIAGAGGAAHLPGMVAAMTPLPVIGVPISATKLDGQDSLLSIVQMPAGVPVATVAIDGGTNAGILAAQIIGLSDVSVMYEVEKYKNWLRTRTFEKEQALKEQFDV